MADLPCRDLLTFAVSEFSFSPQPVKGVRRAFDLPHAEPAYVVAVDQLNPPIAHGRDVGQAREVGEMFFFEAVRLRRKPDHIRRGSADGLQRDLRIARGTV